MPSSFAAKQQVAVIGSGILGVTSALSLARAGFGVTLFEREPELWNLTSRAGEGKVHLGLVYPLGDEGTRDFMLRGALSFSPIIDSLVQSPVNWRDIVSEPFTYLVMPDSLLSIGELRVAYDHQEALFQTLSSEAGNTYLGAPLRQLVDTHVGRHKLTGLPAYRTSERAVNPDRLRAFLIRELIEAEHIEVLMSSCVHEVTNDDVDGSAKVSYTSGGTTLERSFHAVVNCAWENQSCFIDQDLQESNLRFKTGLRIPREVVDMDFCDSVTFVIGPFGDMVRHDSFVYVSWYPIARIPPELGTSPSAEMLSATRDALSDRARAQAQLDVFAGLGFFGPNSYVSVEEIEITGGFVLGEGKLDIDHIDSGLHSRPNRGVIREGRIFSPRNDKFTTAPLMASLTAQAVKDLLL